jgi:hypothetical protein
MHKGPTANPASPAAVPKSEYARLTLELLLKEKPAAVAFPNQLPFHLAMSLALIAAAFICYRVISVHAITAGFPYLLCVLGVATTCGLIEAIVASIASG